MKYFVIEISEGDARIAGKGIYEYETEKDAIGSFHQKLATAMRSELYTADLVMVIDSYGTVIKKERYAVPAPVEAPVEE